MQRVWCTLLFLLAVTVTLHPVSASILAANITTDTSVPDVWTYTVINNQSAGSPDYVSEFDIAINGPVTVTAEPTGWTYQIGDLCQGVDCIKFESNGDSSDVAPGSSLGGFSISSPGSSSVLSNAVAYSWNHTTEDAGPASGIIQVETPSDPVPEPWTGSTVGLALLVGSFWLRKKSRRTNSVSRLTA